MEGEESNLLLPDLIGLSENRPKRRESATLNRAKKDEKEVPLPPPPATICVRTGTASISATTLVSSINNFRRTKRKSRLRPNRMILLFNIALASSSFGRALSAINPLSLSPDHSGRVKKGRITVSHGISIYYVTSGIKAFPFGRVQPCWKASVGYLVWTGCPTPTSKYWWEGKSAPALYPNSTRMAIHTYWCAAALNRPDRPNPVVFTKNRSTISYLMNMNFL